MTVPSQTGSFPPATLAQWQRLALGVLRRSGLADEDTPPEAVDDLLAVTTYDGIRVRPLYTGQAPLPPTGEPGSPPFTRGGVRPAGWDIRQRHADPDPKATREAILTDLDNGVTSVWLDLGGGGGGIDPSALPAVLDGVYLDLAGVVLDAGAQTEAAAEALFAVVAERGVAPAKLSGNLGADPLGWQARTGDPADLGLATGLARRCAVDYPGLRALTVDATAYHDAGGSDAEELACAVATGVAYLRALTDGAAMDVSAALAQLEFRYAAGADQFLTIAKLRAARRLWSRVAQVCGAPAGGPQRQHAVTSSAMMTARDPWVNMLRTTVACFAAGVGGADAITVAPFDAALGLPDGFARRIARNTQSLLTEEAGVARVADPAGGSWYVERLTEDLAGTAWAWFTEIERAGGMAAALGAGLIADRLAATWARRADNLAHRRDAVVGVSEFPNLSERLPARASLPTRPEGGLPRHRYAEAFESLRDRADAHPGGRPTVFLATLGPLAAYSARAAFAGNLFAAGGIATVLSGSAGVVSTVPGTGDEVAQTVAAFRSSAAAVACLCSSDKLYAEGAAPMAAALRAAGATRVWLAGPPGDYDGVDSYLYSGCDALDVLSTTLRDLAVA
jgi:methylmalonyl-CoA mutase